MFRLLRSLSLLCISILALIISLPLGAQTLFEDHFDGTTLNSAWVASLPHISTSPTGAWNATYLGEPNYSFQTLGTSSVLRMTNLLDNQQLMGWKINNSFIAKDFIYEVRFNTLIQSAATSIDGFIELWIMDAEDNNRHDIVNLFGSGYSVNKLFTTYSSVDGIETTQDFHYVDNTWYRLQIIATEGRNLRAALLDDNGIELMSQTFNHASNVYGSGFTIGLAQWMGTPDAVYPLDVAVDYVRLKRPLERLEKV